jgi:hypothetical protein
MNLPVMYRKAITEVLGDIQVSSMLNLFPCQLYSSDTRECQTDSVFYYSLALSLS